MNATTRRRLFGLAHAFDHPVTLWIVAGMVVLLVVTPAVMLAVHRLFPLDDKLRRELWQRYLTWLVLSPLMILPVLAGAAITVAAVAVLGVGCYFELIRHTPVKSEPPLNTVVIGGIAGLSLGALDHWWQLFSAAWPLTLVLLAAVAVLPDRPQGYLQRVSIASTAFAFFGVGLGHLSYLTNDPGYRPVLLLILLAVEVNDILAFVCGKAFGHRKLAPNTSPGKTLGGSLGALGLTSVLFAAIGRFVFTSGPLHTWSHLLIMGLLLSLLGQLGDLMLSAIKRDLGVKDLGTLLPGHGGLLDRFDSLILVAPALFYYIGHFQGLGLDEPVRLFF